MVKRCCCCYSARRGQINDDTVNHLLGAGQGRVKRSGPLKCIGGPINDRPDRRADLPFASQRRSFDYSGRARAMRPPEWLAWWLGACMRSTSSATE